jgi:hypothetical protein
MAWRPLQLALATTAMLTMATACASASGRLYVRNGPPPVVVERVIAAPGPDFVWQPGHYRWTGRDYVWIPGRYERAPHPRAQWVAGRWAHGPRGWYFIDGRWR